MRIPHPATSNPRRWAGVRQFVLEARRVPLPSSAAKPEGSKLTISSRCSTADRGGMLKACKRFAGLVISPSHGPTLPGLIQNGISGGRYQIGSAADLKPNSRRREFALFAIRPKRTTWSDLSSAGGTGLKTGNHTHGSIGHNVSIMDSQTK